MQESERIAVSDHYSHHSAGMEDRQQLEGVFHKYNAPPESLNDNLDVVEAMQNIN